MKQSFVALLLLLSASFILPSCEKAVIDEYPQMESFYVESKGLNFVTIDSARSFSGKVDVAAEEINANGDLGSACWGKTRSEALSKLKKALG